MNERTATTNHSMTTTNEMMATTNESMVTKSVRTGASSFIEAYHDRLVGVVVVASFAGFRDRSGVDWLLEGCGPDGSGKVWACGGRTT